MRIPDHILNEIRARLPISRVVGRKVALKKAGKEFRGLSPFKTEKTPSFYANDNKAFYHCFASGEHGDIFDFVMKTEGLSFREAVELLAGEAGVTIPADKPATEAEIAAADRAERLLRANTDAARFFRQSLSRSPEAQRYLEAREISSETIAEFEIGFAPDDWRALRSALLAAGHTEADLIDAGLTKNSERGTYDAFRDRLMIPIHDARGRVIAFGGRAIDPSVSPKYLNTSETDLFRKGSTLFNRHRARQHVHKSGRVIVVEGYMDVIALAQIGIGEAVAPLGTAITIEQLQLIWRGCRCPVIMLDGDAAGTGAAHRLADLALPLITADRTLRFARLPSGSDPDDVARNDGRDAIEAIISGAIDLVDVLWGREWANRGADTPENRAALDERLDALASKISSKSVAYHYRREFRSRTWEARRRSRPTATTSSLSMPTAPAREAWLLCAALDHHDLLVGFAETLAGMAFAHEPFSMLRDAMLAAAADDTNHDAVGHLLRTHASTIAAAREASRPLQPTQATPETFERMSAIQDQLVTRIARLREEAANAEMQSG